MYVIRYVSLLAILFASSSCARKVNDAGTSYITITAGSKVLNSAPWNASNFQSATNSTMSVGTGPQWGLSDPTAMSEISCYAVFVGGSDLGSSYCNNTSGQEIMRFGIKAGLAAAGTPFELAVPSGSNRNIFVVGLKKSSGNCEKLMDNQDPTFANYSNPFLLGKTTVNLKPGDQTVYIRAEANFTAANKVGHCTFLNSNGGTTPTALALSEPVRSLALSATHTFTATGGTAPYVFSLVSGTGTITGAGVFVAPGTSATSVYRVTDSTGLTVDGTIYSIVSGSLDTSFNTLGYRIDDFGSGFDDEVFDVAVQSDNKPVAVGWCYQSGFKDWCVTRYNEDGSLDTTFNSVGKLYIDSFAGSENSLPSKVTIDSNGKILMAGQCGSASADTCIYRVDTNGTLDSTFGTGGKVLIDISGSSYVDRAYGIHSLASGKIIVTGDVDVTGGADFNFYALRLNGDGSVDTTFGTSGKTVSNMGGTDDYVRGSTVDSSGKIFIYGQTTASTRYAILKLNSDGSPDNSFGAAGKSIWYDTISTDSRNITSVALQSNGKIVFGGFTMGAASDTQWTVGRLNADGAVDTSFGTSGYNYMNNSSEVDIVNQVLVDSEGRIVVLGSTESSAIKFLKMERLTSNGSIDTTFGTSGFVDLTATGAKATSYNYNASFAFDQHGSLVVGARNASAYSDFWVGRILYDGR